MSTNDQMGTGEIVGAVITRANGKKQKIWPGGWVKQLINSLVLRCKAAFKALSSKG